MRYNLMEIRDYVLKLAEVVSEVLRVDVEIVDRNLIRIAGTGRYKNKTCISIENESFIYRKVIETGKKQVIENPGFHKLCNDCPKRNSCIEKFECCTPIIIDGEVAGVIALISFTEMQKKIILDKFKEYTDFLDKISELIASKAKESHSEVQRESLIGELKTIINYIQDYVLVIEEEGKVRYTNNKFKTLLKEEFNIDDITYMDVKITDYGERLNINNSTQFNITINGLTRKVLGCVNEIFNGRKKSKVIIFQDMKKFQKVIYEHSDGKNVLDFSSIIGNSKEALKIQLKARSVANGHAAILITGESGTGKELFARAIHNESGRSKGPFIAINCGAIPDSLLESELFGYVPGAFTGASKSGKIGKFELASKGTIFLDEIGDMPLHLQVKLLRVLQDKVVIPIGSNKPIIINVRVVSATNKDLEKMVINGEFREDLYYRLNVIPLEIPPLRKRQEDIPILAQHFLKKYCNYYEVETPVFSEKVMNILKNYYWHGNVRELENTVEYIVNVIQGSGSIEPIHLPPRIIENEEPMDNSSEYNLEAIEKRVILRAIKQFGANTEDKRNVSKALGISLSTLYRKMDRYDIKKDENYY